MVDISVKYSGQLRCRATHGPSGSGLTTDAPVDNHGRGESFSPTDLVATALATCMATVMGIECNGRGWNIDGTVLDVRKNMSASGPRRIVSIPVSVHVPKLRADELDGDAKARLIHVAETCPVRLSIHDSIAVPLEFHWG